MGVRKGPANDWPKALTRWVCVCHPPAVMPGLGQAPFWLIFPCLPQLQDSIYKERVTEVIFKRQGEDAAYGREKLHFPPLDPALSPFLTLQLLTPKLPMLLGTFPRCSAGPLENRDLQSPSHSMYIRTHMQMAKMDFSAHRQPEFWQVLMVSSSLKKLFPKKRNWSLENSNDPLSWVTDKVQQF